jgi:hypothetical protein
MTDFVRFDLKKSQTVLFYEESNTGFSVASVATKNTLLTLTATPTLMTSRKYSELIPIQNIPLSWNFDFRMGSDSFKFKFKVVHISNSPIKYSY